MLAALLASSLNLILSWIMQQLIDAAAGTPGTLRLPSLIWISLGFLAFCAFVSLLGYLAEPRFLARAMRQYRDFAFRRLTEKSISSFRDESTAAYLSALTNDAGSIETDYLSQQLSVITKLVTFLGALGMMLWYSPVLTAVAAGLMLLPLAASILTGNQLQTAETRVSDRNRDFTAALRDCLDGFPVVKTFRAEKEIFRLFAESNRALEDEKFSRRRLKLLVGMIGALTGVVAQLGVFLAGTWLALTGHGLTAGTVILFVNLMNFLIEPVSALPALLAGQRAARALIAKLAEALERNPAAEGTVQLSGLQTGIRLENVSFGYTPDTEVLHGISAEFQAGRAYAIVGGSGETVSTMVQHAAALNHQRMILVGPDVLDGDGTRRSAALGAAALAGVLAAERDPALPVNGAGLRGIGGTAASLTEGEIDSLVRGGVTPLESLGGVTSPIRGITTKTKTGGAADASWREITTILIVDDVIPTLRESLGAKFLRSKNTARNRGAIRAQVIVELERKREAEIIEGYGEVTARASEDDPTVCEVEFPFAVAHGLNQIYLTAHITV